MSPSPAAAPTGVNAVFCVLHVCTGNICRSPMSERILDGLTGDEVYNHGVGTSDFHQGESMHANSRLELIDRGFEPDGHRARRIEREHVESSDLILVATAGHLEYIAERFPEALDRTFPVRQFGRIAADALQRRTADPAGGDLQTRAKALVAEAAQRRGEYPEEDLADPWGLGRASYTDIADQLTAALEPVAEALEESR
ncbi:arsenate reductase/protein-tyrosine-phosphatase family protein [Glycomyces xiaoerkulensis]|uniref:arsenate reductase/protein-tyrosine-phosphatase family protein n=1 Tax=Glycomyces xiaoerkulensis TaxID=2038139 RepID=UPI000C25AA36|nr:phosphotyrosine protein phosphatase [Glycomyces xiaoerkulensis]